LDAITAIVATWLAGGTVTILPLPRRRVLGRNDEAALLERLDLAEAHLVVTDGSRVAALLDRADLDVVALDRIEAAGRDRRLAAPGRPGPPILQFTSGTTGHPRPITISSAALMAQIEALVEVDALDPTADHLVSWMPLFHDFGLVHFVALPVMTGARLTLTSPSDFARDPRGWWRMLAEVHGTMTAAPDSVLGVSARALARGSPLDLRSLRRVIDGGEMVSPGVVRAFQAALVHHGAQPGALATGYGLAEATLAVAATRPGETPAVHRLDALALEEQGQALPADAAAAREVVDVGRSVERAELRIGSGPPGLPDRTIGEISVRAPFLADGVDTSNDGWLATGDLGFLLDGRLTVTGRCKDVLVFGGRTVSPHDVETAIQDVPGIRPARTVAFSAVGSGGLVVLAEADGASAAMALARSRVAAAVRREIGLRVEQVLIVERGVVPVTTSGKLRRAECRRLHAEGHFGRADSG
jgi:fatty-acyl-CoA synthase